MRSLGLIGAVFCLSGFASSQVQINIAPTSLAAATAGTPYSQTLTASGGAGSYTWSAQVVGGGPLPTWLTLGSSTGVLSGTPPASGTLNITVTATDLRSNSGQLGMSLLINFASTVITTNLPAGMAIVNISGAQCASDSVDSARPCTAAVGGNGAAVSGGTNQSLWFQPFNTLGQALEYTIPQAGTYTFRVIDPADAHALFPNLAQGQLNSIWTAWTFNNPWLTDYLVFRTTALQNSGESQIFSGAGGVPGDANGASFTAAYNYEISNFLYNLIYPGARDAAPQTTFTFDTPTTLVFAAPDNQLGDNAGGVSVLIAPAASQGLSITTSSISNGQVGVAYQQTTLTATGGSGIYNWSAFGLPPGLALSTAGVLNGTPTSFTGSPFSVSFTVIDPVSGASFTQDVPFHVTIAPPSSPLTITTATLPNGGTGAAYTAPVAATGGFGTYTWSISADAPLGINASTGQLTSSGTLGSGNLPQFTVTVQDTAGDNASQRFTVTVDPALSIDRSNLPDGQVGTFYSQILSGSGGSGNYTWRTGSEDDRLNLSITPIGQGLTARLSGTPSSEFSDGGRVQVILTDLSTGQILTQDYFINVSAAPRGNGAGQSGLTAWVLQADGGLFSDTSNVITQVLPGGQCGDFSCFDLARDAAGNFIIPATNQLLRIKPDGTQAADPIVAADPNSLYTSVTVDSGGNYIVVDDGLHQVVRISPDGINGTPVTYPVSEGDFNEDAFVRIDSGGNYILVEDNTENSVAMFRINPNSSQPAAVPISLHPAVVDGLLPYSPGGMTFDAQGNYVLTDWDSGLIFTVTPDGTTSVLFDGSNSGLRSPEGIMRDPVSGNFYIVDDSENALYTLDPTGSTLTALTDADAFSSPEAIILVNNVAPGSVDYVLESNANIVPVGGGTAVACSQSVCGDSAFDFAADASGNFIIASGNALAKVTQAGVSSTIANPTDSSHWVSVTVDSFGNYIVADNFAHQLVKVTPAGIVTPIATYPVDATDTDEVEDVFVRIDGSGNYALVHDNAESIRAFRITPAGVVTEIALGGLLPFQVGGLALDSTGNYVLSDTNQGAIDLLTFTSGTAATGSRLAADSNELLEDPLGIFRDPATGRFLLVDDDSEALFSLSPDGTQLLPIANNLSNPIAVLSIGSGPLTITTSALPAGTPGQTYVFGPLAASGGSGNYSWSATGLPPGLSITAGGLINGVPGTTSPAQSSVLVTVTDTSNTNLTATKALQLAIGTGATPPPPSPPSLSISGSTSSIQTTPGGTASASFTASGGVSPYTFSASGLPAGVTMGSTSFSGSPTQSGTFIAAVTVTDTQRATAQTSVTIYVLGLTTTSLPGGTAGQFYTAAIGAVGGSNGYSFSASGLPAGLAITSDGHINGTANTAGTYTLTVTVASGGVSVSGPFSLTIAKPLPLSVTTALLPDGTVNTLYSQALGAHGGLPPYTWTIISGTLPAGLSTNGQGVVSGTPGTAGSTSFGVQVTDTAGAFATATVGINIHAAPLIITPQSLPSGMSGVDYPTQLLGATGGVSPYTWAVSSGSSLPSGLALSTAGALGGVPAAAGSSSPGITVTDSTGTKASATFALTIRPSAADLILTSGSLAFSLLTPAVNPPDAQTVGVQSTVASQQLAYTISVNPAAPWLTVSGGASTPDTLQVSITSAALSLSAGDYQTTITATCASSVCTGHTQKVAVDLNVAAAPARLEVGTTLLSFATTIADSGPLSQSINVQNAGGGAIGFASVTCQAAWCTAGAPPSSLAGNVDAVIPVTVNPAVVSPGFYRTQVDIVTSAGRDSVPVTLFIAPSATMTLAPAGQQFNMPAGSVPGNPNGSFLVSVNSASANWTASVIPGADWITLGTTSGTSTSTQPGTVSFSIDPVKAGALAAGAYYGRIEVVSTDLSNSPQDFEVVLNVVPAGSPLVPDPEPAGLLFISAAGATLPPQTITVYSGSTSPLTYQTSAATADGGTWLSVTPGIGSAAAGAPGITTASVSTAGLKAGIYRGGVSYSLSATAVRTVNVTLVVTASAPAASVSGNFTPRALGCVAAKLAPTQTGLVNNFSQPAAWPTPLVIQLSNDCGSVVTNGQVVATFSNGDPPLALPLVDPGKGLYSGTWSPRKATSQLAINVRASAPGLPDAISQIAGAVVPNPAPVLTPHGTLHSFDPLVGAALAPGTIVQIYGENLASQTAQPTSIPLPTGLNGTSVIFGGVEAPLYYVSAGQVNAQIPFELQPGKQYQVIVSANGALTTPDTIQLSQATPGLAAFGDGTLIAQHGDGTLVSKDSPARAGEYLVAYLAGMGGTDVVLASGAASPGSPLAEPTDPPVLTINGAPSPLLFAGLTPGLVGLYQMNFQVPAGLAAGNITISITQDGQSSNQTVLPYLP